MKKRLLNLVVISAALLLVGCQSNPSSTPNNSTPNTPTSSVAPISSSTSVPTPISSSTVIDSIKDKYDCISIARAKEIAASHVSDATTERYYVYGTIVAVTNPSYGEMTITDGTEELYVYGTYSADGVKRYSELDEKPVAGDEVVLYGTLQYFSSTTYQIKSGWIVDFKHNEPIIDIDDYKAATVKEAREAKKGDLLKLTGVVAQITYANGKIPSGFYLVDKTESIYVYDSQIALQVAIGNTVTIAAIKDYWILEDETSNAQKYGYKGCNQVTKATLLENDKKVSAYDNSWIKETTVKSLLNTPYTEDITTSIYKVNALVKKVEGTGFVNYYFNDIDGETGTYTYTQCSGADFDWLDEFDNKICTVYLSVLNAKSTVSGCQWRILPITVIDENYKFDLANTPAYVMEYHAKDQFKKEYTGDPILPVVTKVSSTLLGFENATVSYSSNNKDVIYFETANGETVMHAKDNGKAIVEITASYSTYTAVKETVEITVAKPVEVEAMTVGEVLEAPYDAENKVTVRGIAGPSLVNQVGFYLIDASGVIAILTDNDTMTALALGNEVIIEGYKTHRTKSEEGAEGYKFGQTFITESTVVANLYGKHEYSTASFDSTKTLADLLEMDVAVDQSTQVYTIKATVTAIDGGFSSTIYINDGDKQLILYCSSAGQYSWLRAFAGKGEITMEVALCDWNTKGYKGCVLSAIDPETNTKVFNTLNYPA